MKFGKQLFLKQYEEWRGSYINYKDLVHKLKELAQLSTAQPEQYAEAEKKFIDLVKAEAERVDAAYLQLECQVNQEVKKLMNKYRETKITHSPESLAILRNDVLTCSQSIFYLQEFGGLNGIGFQKLLKKTEKLLGKANVPWVKGFKTVYTNKHFYTSKKPTKFHHIAAVSQISEKLCPTKSLIPSLLLCEHRKYSSPTSCPRRLRSRRASQRSIRANYIWRTLI